MHYYYDMNNNVTDIIEKRFVFPNYVEYRKRTWTYNLLNNIKSYRKYDWLAATAYWMPERSNESQVLYYYEGENTSVPIEQTKLAGNIKLYPNPAMGNMINIEIENPAGDSADVMMYDITGRLIKRQTLTVNNGVIQLPINELASGQYYVSISHAGKEMTKTLSIAR